jgi:hypothetical protein
MTEPNIPGAGEWEPWFPEQASELLRGCGVEWAVVGGWALDLERGTQSRPHKDLEIVIRRPGLDIVRRHLSRYEFFRVKAGRLTPMNNATLPDPSVRQHWVYDPVASKWRLDVMVEPGDDQTWVYRRDPRISARRAQVTAITDRGVPYLRPSIILLFKAQQQRPVDELDFTASLCLLQPSERAWLRDALRISDPRHQWIERLE